MHPISRKLSILFSLNKVVTVQRDLKKLHHFVNNSLRSFLCQTQAHHSAFARDWLTPTTTGVFDRSL